MNKQLKPILKWAGGKRQLLSIINPLIPGFSGRYYEPFVGGGAVVFSLQPSKAMLNDFNSEIIRLYKVVKDKPEELVDLLREPELNSRKRGGEYYYLVRNLDREEKSYGLLTDEERAARTLFLNRTCYNGLYRVNKKGQFNTPVGRYKNPEICCETAIDQMSVYFRTNDITFTVGDYGKAIENAQKNDFVYLDPPYYPISRTASFTDYTMDGFGKSDQERLHEDCEKLNKKGVRFLQSNSDCELIRDLYKGYIIKPVPVKRSINAIGTKRNGAIEVLIANYEI